MSRWPRKCGDQSRGSGADDVTATAPETDRVTAAARDAGESPDAPGPNTKRRLLMMSVPSAASHSGQQKPEGKSVIRRK